MFFELIAPYIILFFLIIIQSIAGVGILLLGTPLFLILNFNFVDILRILLPLSILTSFLNIIFLKVKNKKKIKIDKDTKKKFYFVTIPSIYIGLIILNKYENILNFKYLVSSIIFLTIIITYKKFHLGKINKKTKILIMGIIGIIHGLTNSGGSILSLFFSSIHNKTSSRYFIHYFYFLLALTQYIIFIMIFGYSKIKLDFLFIILSIPISFIIGNILAMKIEENFFKKILLLLAIISCFGLIVF